MNTNQKTSQGYVTKEINETWKCITLRNNFLFFKIMQDEKRLQELLRRVLPEINIKKLKVVGEKTIQAGVDIHGVRLDVYAEDESGRPFTIEMQVNNTDNIPKRMRFYSSMVDSQVLDKGERYEELPDSFIVIICCFDLYGMGLHKYSFRAKCDQVDGLAMGDGVKYVVLNTTSFADDVDSDLRAFLDYVEGRDVKDDSYIAELDEAVVKARMNKRWRKEYMTVEQERMHRDSFVERRGEERKLISQVVRKMQIGQEDTEIAEDLMEELDSVRRIMQAANECGPTAEINEVYNYIHRNDGYEKI